MSTATMPTGIDPAQLIEDAIQKAQELIGKGLPDLARDLAKQILRCCPDHPDGVELLGLACHQKREYAQAVKHLRRAVELQPENADFLNNLALPLAVLGRVEEAIDLLRQAVELAPRNPQFRANLGLQYRGAGRTEQALAHLRESLELRPLATTYVNLGGTLGEAHRLDEATECFRQAISLEPDNAMAHTDLAYSLHLSGHHREAWEEYEWRLRSFVQLEPYLQKYDQKLRWRKGDVIPPGARIAVYCEQGLGDAIQFVRYIPELKRRYDCHVILHCAESLVGLFQGSDLGIDEFFTTPVQQMTWVLPHDFHVAIMSLPHLLDAPEPSGSVPYLTAPVHDLGHADKRRVGLGWAGSPLHPNDRIRSCPLRLFQPVHDLAGVKLFNLCDPRPRRYEAQDLEIDLAAGCDGMRIVDCWPEMTDFARTASILRGLSVVVTVDTALMHLAGALGLPTIGLLGYNPDWRWGLDGADSAWYPTLTLIRQPAPGDWAPVFAQLMELLEQ